MRTAAFHALHGQRPYDTVVVVIAIGILGKPNKPDYRFPVTLKDRILFDVTRVPIANADVLVAEGGIARRNTASTWFSAGIASRSATGAPTLPG